MRHPGFAATPHLELALAGEDCDSLQDEVEAWVQHSLLPIVPPDCKLLSIDGLDGVGKSTLGKALAHCIGATLIQLDDFLEQDQNCYLGALDLADFQKNILASSKAVVEGCLVQAALNKVGLSSEFRIYVLRSTKMYAQPDAEWIDEQDLLFGEKSAEQWIAEEEDSMRRWSAFLAEADRSSNDYKVPGLRQELIRYHTEMHPHKRADLILKLVRMK